MADRTDTVRTHARLLADLVGLRDEIERAIPQLSAVTDPTGGIERAFLVCLDRLNVVIKKHSVKPY